MIFKKLTLKNFMSYANAEIDFSGIHLACLSGPNGAGKSSLLDAVTWALWEEGRSRTDDLIKLGKDEMSCELEFFSDGELYRVYRSRSKSFKNAQGKSSLEFQIFNPKDQQWTSLTLSSVRQTQDLVIKTIRMDHETFVNSVYLRQGKADEFTLKKPSERKQVLADILGLGVYDKLCDASRLKINEIEKTIGYEESFISELKTKIQNEDEIKAGCLKYKSELDEREKKLKEITESLKIKEAELNKMKEKEKHVHSLERTVSSHESITKTLQDQFVLTGEKIKKSRSLIDNKLKIQNEHEEYLRIKEELEIADQKRQRHERLTLEKNKLEHELKDRIADAEKKIVGYRSKISDRNNRKTELTNLLGKESEFEKFLPEACKETKTFSDLHERIQMIEKEALELKHKNELLNSDLKKMGLKVDEISGKIRTLDKNSEETECPLCKSQIKDKESVIASYKDEINLLQEEKKKIIDDISVNEDKVEAKRKEYSDLKTKIDSFGKIVATLLPKLENIRSDGGFLSDVSLVSKTSGQKAVSFLESKIEVVRNDFQRAKTDLQLIEKEINSYTHEVNEIESLVSNGAIVKEISDRLSAIKSEIENIKYDSMLHENLRKSFKNIENIIITFNSLKQAESEYDAVLREEQQLSEKIKQAGEEVLSLKKMIQDIKKDINDMPQLENEVSAVRHKEIQSTDTLNEVKKQLVISEQLLLEIEKSKHLILQKEEKIKDQINEKKYFDILEKAFSKNGIQVALIETTVPEIENEANRILSRLTDNQMHVALKTQKEKKTSTGIIETLDVIIADNAGSRNYELYSGGEAFKVNFSLRLALSRLLANRSSARLQTLIIDEGFGSQDASGKERLIEAIRSIQNEFELILVVTHIDELKESFPVHIQITKENESSKVKLVA